MADIKFVLNGTTFQCSSDFVGDIYICINSELTVKISSEDLLEFVKECKPVTEAEEDTLETHVQHTDGLEQTVIKLSQRLRQAEKDMASNRRKIYQLEHMLEETKQNSMVIEKILKKLEEEFCVFVS